jgi:hypothetical protein
MTTQLNRTALAMKCAEVIFDTQEELEAAAIDWAGETLKGIFEDYGIKSESTAIDKLSNWDNYAELIDTDIEDWNLYQRFYCVETETFGTVYLKEDEA